MAAVRGPRRREKRRGGVPVPAGELVAARRLALGLTQIELADLSDVGLSSVRRLEAGEITLSLAVVSRIVEALGLAVVVGPSPVLEGLEGVVPLASGSRRTADTADEPG